MVNFFSLLITISAASSALANAVSTPSQTGMNGGFYYAWQTLPDNKAAANYTNSPEGQFSVKWAGKSSFYGGKGWSAGTSDRKLSYTATNRGKGSSRLGLYGWTTEPLVEYHIVESWTGSNPAIGATFAGSVSSDGSIYDLFVKAISQQPSIRGTADFEQYWAVRRDERKRGKLNVGSIVKGWEKAGLKLGEHSFQIFAVQAEGLSSGVAEVTIKERK